MDDPRIVLIYDSDDGAFLPFLQQHLCIGINATSPEAASEVLQSSRVLGPYLVAPPPKGHTPAPDAIRVYAPTPRTSTDPSLRCSWEAILQGVSLPIGLLCAAGGTKAFIELLKCWVEERKGRKIRIKRGDDEIVIEGGVNRRDVDHAIRLLETRFGKSKIIRP